MFVRRKGWVTINFTASRGGSHFLTKNIKGGLGDFSFMLIGIPPAHPTPPTPLLKNECSLIKSPSTDLNVLWFCFNCSKRRNIFGENFFKIGNSRRNIKLLVTGYVINYLTADCHMPNRKGGKWPWDFNALGKCLLWIPEPAWASHWVNWFVAREQQACFQNL